MSSKGQGSETEHVMDIDAVMCAMSHNMAKLYSSANRRIFFTDGKILDKLIFLFGIWGAKIEHLIRPGEESVWFNLVALNSSHSLSTAIFVLLAMVSWRRVYLIHGNVLIRPVIHHPSMDIVRERAEVEYQTG